ncbi:hypothetical protein P7C73_g3447, partial [Tremellales sp. Uapishka_1]
MSTTAKVAVCQIRSNNDPKHNLSVSSQVIRDAVSAGATICFLPEAADFIALTDQECRDLSAPLSSHPYVLGLQSLAKELNVAISVAVHELPEPEERDDENSLRVYNTHVFISSEGKLLAKYRKVGSFSDTQKVTCRQTKQLHLFDVKLTSPALPDGSKAPPATEGESDRIRPGKKVVAPIDLGAVGKLGLMICYDIRFPELHTILRRLGADILAVPAAFALKTGRDHWPTLLRALAIQQQTYVLASGQYGKHNTDNARSSWGEAIAFDPWGKQLGRLRSIDDDKAADGVYEKGGEFFICEVGAEAVESTRTQIPLAIQKRADIYGVVGENAPVE